MIEYTPNLSLDFIINRELKQQEHLNSIKSFTNVSSINSIGNTSSKDQIIKRIQDEQFYYFQLIPEILKISKKIKSVDLIPTQYKVFEDITLQDRLVGTIDMTPRHNFAISITIKVLWNKHYVENCINQNKSNSEYLKYHSFYDYKDLEEVSKNGETIKVKFPCNTWNKEELLNDIKEFLAFKHSSEYKIIGDEYLFTAS